MNSPAEFLQVELCSGILPSNHVTVKLAAKAKDEKNNANKIKNA